MPKASYPVLSLVLVLHVHPVNFSWFVGWSVGFGFNLSDESESVGVRSLKLRMLKNQNSACCLH